MYRLSRLEEVHVGDSYEVETIGRMLSVKAENMTVLQADFVRWSYVIVGSYSELMHL